jgi:carboxymethylenebutenolidase
VDCYVPQGQGKLPAVIGLYGMHGGHITMGEPARLLAAEGFAVYVLHYLDRTGAVEPNKGSLVKNFPAWMKTLWDAVSFVHQQPEVDAARTALLGYSLGAYLALTAAAIDGRITAVVECFGGFPKEMKFFMRRMCPVLILHGEADGVVPVAEAYHLKELLEKRGVENEMKIYAGVGHGFSGEVFQDAARRTVAFLRRMLKPLAADFADVR